MFGGPKQTQVSFVICILSLFVIEIAINIEKDDCH